MDVFEAINTRTSARNLVEPGPTDAQWAILLHAACRAPDHGRLRPWNFLIIRGEARRRLGEVMAQALRLGNPQLPPEALDRERSKPLRAPAILAVAATPKPHPTIPEVEQIVACGAAAQNILLAAHALGLGAMWRTGSCAYDAHVCGALGLRPGARIVGFLYLGTAEPSTGGKIAADPVRAVEWHEVPRDFVVPAEQSRHAPT